MPTKHEQIVQRGFDAFETADMDAFTADWHPDVVWDLRHHETWAGDRYEYVGAAVRSALPLSSPAIPSAASAGAR